MAPITFPASPPKRELHLVLDSQTLGLLTNSVNKPDVAAISAWLNDMKRAGNIIYLPEIIDYELRRELVRANKPKSLTLLDALPQKVTYIPLATDAPRTAASLWAWARNNGVTTGDPKKIDVDVILAAQAQLLGAQIQSANVIVVTSNVAHLQRFVNAETWANIKA